ncbi:hypothetical protein BFW88_05565 [Pseudomonas fluorescens]|nr:hypothetical protein [Pseudomonas lactucae]OPA96298.1 hypothetical protein BFW88_05565 [Pseudomonas fluorescens]OPB13276.1 hypothetical protein BFW92_05540 [Pseudomonas fluorescens]OPB26425.1 hypothetical protein BFW93_05560 [Pseudomonas fluorescens]
MLGMARGQESLGQDGAQDVGDQQGKMDSELLKKLLEMLAGAGGAQGGGGSGSGGSGDQPDADQIRKMMSGRQGMEAMMPDSDNGRQIPV